MADKKTRAYTTETPKDTKAKPADTAPDDDAQDEPGTMKIRMANASHGAAYPGDVVEVPEEEGAAILQAWEGRPVTEPDDDSDDDDDDKPAKRGSR
jgi:hypothetical protein